MKKTKRIISVIVAFAMMLTMALPVMAANGFSDVPLTHQYYTAITNLTSEGILNGMGDGVFQPEGPVTRAQFTKIVCYALSMGDLQYSEEERSIFKDVVPSHWAANNILTAYKRGIVNGLGDNLFGPENGVRYEDAVIMVMRALGYSDKEADRYRGEQGAYYAGYMSLASSKKLLKGIKDAKIGEVMTRGAIAQLVDNMLDTEQIVDGESQGSIRDEIGTSNKIEGQVVAAYGVALHNDPNPCYKNQIELDLGGDREDNLVDIGELSGFDINKFLGRSVTVYYEREEGSSERVATNIALQPKKNEETKIDLDMIYDYDSESIEYFTDDSLAETETIKVVSSKNLLNGDYTTDSVEDILDGIGDLAKPGHITLIASGSTETADVAFVKTYETMIVQSVSSKDNKVYGKNSININDSSVNNLVLDVNDRSKKVSIKMDGRDYALSSIRENHVLSISYSDKAIEVLVTAKSASGTIINMTTTDKIQLDSGNTVYTISPDVQVHDGTLGSITVGKHVTISLDAFGKVARVVFTAKASYSYGYLADLNVDDGVIDAMVYKPVASNKELSSDIYRFANKVKINGDSYTVEDDAESIKTRLATDASYTDINVDVTGAGVGYVVKECSQPIRFTVNKSGQIDSILTNRATGDPATSLNIISHMDYTAAEEDRGIKCTIDGKAFGTYSISPSTPIIYVPADRTRGTYYGKTNTFFNEGDSYYVQFANKNSTGVVGCVYVYGVVGGDGSVSATITEETIPMIVSDVAEVSVDTSTKKFTLVDVITGTTLECLDNNVAGSAGLNTGDVVRVALTEKEVDEVTYSFIESLEVLAVATEVAGGTTPTDELIKTQGAGEGTVNAEFRTLIGKVKSKSDMRFTVVSGFNAAAVGTEPTYTATSTTPVHIIDTAANDINKVQTMKDFNEIQGSVTNELSSTVMIYTSEAALKAIIIFR